MGKANRGRDTGPERALRSALHRRGLRFNVQRRVEPSLRVTADIVFPRRRVVVFLDGCFWHRCPQHGTTPKANGEWWQAKLNANVARDRRTDVSLAEHGWMVLRVWEHEDPGAAAERIEHLVRSRT